MTEPSADVEELIDAARYGDLEDVTAALASKTPINGTDELGRTGLHMACANGHIDIVRLLIESGADVMLANTEGNTPLHWACLNGHLEIVQLLMDSGASPSALNSHDQTPIDEALQHVRRDELLNAITAHASQEGAADGVPAVEFDIETGKGFPQKPQ